MSSLFSRKGFESMSRSLEQASRFMHDKVREAVAGEVGPQGRRDSHYDGYSSSSSSTLVHYQVVDVAQEGSLEKTKYNMFALPCEGYDITVGSVKEHFPVNPAFYRARAFTFRFRCSDDNFDDYVWLDMPEDFDDLRPPTYHGEIWVKALPVKPYRLPESDYYYEEDPEIEAAIAAYRSQFLTASNDCSRPKKKPTISPRGNSVPPSKGYGHQVRQGELDADLMDFGGGHHRTVSNPPSSSSVYPGITSRSSTPAAPQVRAEDLNREALKAARLKAKEERIRAKHEEFASRQREETTKREAKLDAQGRLAEELDHWAYTEQGKPKDIRTLLSNMEEALWPNSGWNAVSAGELMVNTGAVKKAYRKAIILCHPDRHQSASPDEQYRADRIFNALNEAFKRQ